jgi:hypothetical protein
MTVNSKSEYVIGDQILTAGFEAIIESGVSKIVINVATDSLGHPLLAVNGKTLSVLCVEKPTIAHVVGDYIAGGLGGTSSPTGSDTSSFTIQVFQDDATHFRDAINTSLQSMVFVLLLAFVFWSSRFSLSFVYVDDLGNRKPRC